MPIGGSSGGLSSAGPGAGGGAQGPQGAQGNQGTQGHQGNQGNQGFQGSGGAQGSQGNQGTTGAQGPQGGTSVQAVPIAAPEDYTLDTTTYDDTVTGSGKLATAVFSTDAPTFAIAQEGDDFPRLLFVGTEGTIYIGTGAADPYNAPVASFGFDGTNAVLSGLGAKIKGTTSPVEVLGGAGGITFGTNGAGSIVVGFNAGDLVGLYGAAVAQPTVTGALSTVADPSAKAVLTSILAALSATAGLGAFIDGTT